MPAQNTGSSTSQGCARRTAIQRCAAGMLAAGTLTKSPALEAAGTTSKTKIETRPWIKIRGLYGGFPNAILERGKLRPTAAPHA